MVYRWAVGARVKLDPQVAGECIETVRQKNRGQVRPTDLVRAAKATRHPLHGEFEWDDAAAGVSFRIEQAKYILRHIIVEIQQPNEAEPRLVRAFHSVDIKQPRYISIADALSDPGTRQELVARALGEARSWRRRYQDLDELAGVFAALDKVGA